MKGIAAKVGKPGGAPATKKKREYKEVAGRTMDEAEDAAVKAYKKLK